MGRIADRNRTRHIILTLTRMDTEEPRREVLDGMQKDGVCPMEFPELGIENCEYDPETGCWKCWMKALGMKPFEELEE